MNFGEALELLKLGHKLNRAAWNDVRIFVYLVHGSEFEVNRAPLNAIYKMGTKIKYRPHLDMVAADDTCGTWNASDADLLADDWLMLD